MSPEQGFVENHPLGGLTTSKEEAYEVLRKSEEAGLVHLTSNVESGHWFICNCCDCCCGSVRAAIIDDEPFYFIYSLNFAGQVRQSR
ncbi:MAG: hypothetical protein PVG70_15055 [Desulfobacterales bacterium]